MPRQEVLYPYEVTTALTLTALGTADPTNPDLKLEWMPGRAEEDGGRILDLRGVGPRADDALAGWRELRFEVQAEAGEAALGKVLPTGTDYRTSTSLLLSVRCPSTRLRMPVVLEPDNKVIGRWRGDIHLRRHDVKSRIEVQPFLVRKAAIPASATLGGNYARFEGATIGIGASLAVQVDPTIIRGKSPFKIRWVNFREGNEWLRANHSTQYFLSIEGDDPELLLNSADREFRAVLEADPRHGINAAFQKLLNKGIAETAWVGFFHAAVASLTVDETTGEIEPPEGWKNEVLAMFLPRMFPAAGDEATRLHDLVRMRTSQDEVGAMIGLATTVAQSLVNGRKLFVDAQRAARVDVEEVSDGTSPVSA